jgi:membrane protein implicated in regulation of membrane protease activity
VESGDPETWRWIWLGATAAFGVGEIAVAGSFFLAPFAIGAAVATILAFAGVAVGIQWAAFVAISIGALFALRPLARRLDAEGTVLGIGSNRQVGERAHVVQAIPDDHRLGTVLLGREQWRAQSADGRPIAEGTTVVVIEVRGTRVIVEPADGPTPGLDLPSSTDNPDRS